MLEGRTYVPLLHARLAEMRALRELLTPTKNRIFPVIRIRPWLSARSLDRVFEVISEAFGNRSFAVDLDPTRYMPDNDRASYQEFRRLFEPAGAFENYYDLVASADNRIPVIRTYENTVPNLDGQLDHIAAIDRGGVVRIATSAPINFVSIAERCLERNLSNIVFVFDCGWRRDVLQQAAGCVGLVDRLLDVSEDFEIVVAGSSFPDAFGGYGARFAFPIDERVLFSEVRRNINRGELFYGDWGSTRPPTAPVPVRNVPRIDIAYPAQWTCWRSEDGESYFEVANRVISDPAWDGDLNLWGQYVIQSTAEGADPAIRSPAMAAAARVNIHMHAQANFGIPEVVVPDEPVGDDL